MFRPATPHHGLKLCHHDTPFRLSAEVGPCCLLAFGINLYADDLIWEVYFLSEGFNWLPSTVFLLKQPIDVSGKNNKLSVEKKIDPSRFSPNATLSTLWTTNMGVKGKFPPEPSYLR